MKLSAANLAAIISIAWLPACKAQGEYTTEASVEAYDSLAQLHSGTEFDQAHRKFRSGDFEGALNSIEDSIDLKPDVAKSHLLRGRILIEMGEYGQAIYALDRGSDLDSFDFQYPYLMGVAYEQLGRLEQASEVYTAALQLKPDDAASRIALAEVFVQLDRIEDAKTLLKSSSGWSKGEAGFRQALGHIARLEGDDEEAYREFRQAAILTPHDPGVLEDLFRSQVHARDYDDATRTANALSDQAYYQQRPDLRRLHALCLIQTRQPVEARALLKELTSENDSSGDFESWRLMADVATLLSDDRLLSSAATRMVQAEPTRSEGYLTQAVSRRRMGNLDGALESVRLAMARAEGDKTPARLETLILDEIAAKSAISAESEQ